jgi:phosphoglycerate dehydrogenase-like enzyme
MSKLKHNIFIADDMGVSGIRQLNERLNVYIIPGLSNNILLRKVASLSNNGSASSAIIVRSVRKIDSKFLDSLHRTTSVRVICTLSSGFDHIDVKAARRIGIDVLNVPGGNNVSAGEFTIAVMLSIAKGIVIADRRMRKGRFEDASKLNFELKDKTIGIIGVGRVGSYTAKLARAFGMKILGNDIRKDLAGRYRYIKFVALNKLLEASDIVTIHTPLDSSTINLINSKNMSLMKRKSVLINCSRGGTVDETALINVLKKGKLHYAAVDVFKNEPHFDKTFRDLPNVLLTPHLAGKTPESRERMSVIAAKNIMKYFSKGRTSVKLVN